MHTLTHRIASRHVASMTREACIVAVGEFGGIKCLFKNRDRNYTPEVRLYHEILNGVEVLYMKDETTGWCEGINEFGIGIVNAALAVREDEKQGKASKVVPGKGKGDQSTLNTLKDGKRVLRALQSENIEEAVGVIQSHLGGLRGHTLIADKDTTYSLEATWRGHDFHVRRLPNGRRHVRTNHGQFYPDAGYTEKDGDNYLSSLARRDQAMRTLREVDDPSRIAPSIYGRRRPDRTDPLNMVKLTDGMRTTSQVVMDLANKTMLFYLVPKQVEYLGYRRNLPKGYAPKVKLKVFEYTDLDGDGKFDVIRRKKAHGGLLPLQEPAFNLREVAKHLILLEDHLLHVDRRCPDCIWKHILTAEAFADEADTLDGDNPAPPTLSADIRALGAALRAGTDMAVVGQRARAIRKALVPTVARGKVAAGAVTIEDVVHAGVGDLLVMLEDDFPGVALAWRRVGPSKTAWVRVIPNGGVWVPSADRVRPGEEFLNITRLLMRGRRFRLERGGLMSRVAGDTWYHITDRANFRLNPKYAPRDNSISIEDRSGRSGIYLARDIEPWLNGHGYWRPFVAEFDVDPTVRDDPGVHGRWGGEMFVPAASFDKLHLKRVIPLDAWARERYGDFGWVEEQVGRRFDTGDAIQFGPGRRSIDPPRGYRYPGPDVRQMSPEDVKRLKSDLREFRRTRTAATVTVDPAHIDQLRKDVLMIARAADNVASLGDIDRVTRAVRAWRDRWDTFAFTLRQDLESRIRSADRPYDPKYNPNPPDKATAEYYLDRALAPMWDFDSELNRKPRTDTELKDTYGNPWRPPEEVFEDTVRFYLERGYAASRDEAVSEARRYHDRRPPSTREEAEAAAVARWKAEAVKWTRRLRDKARKAWDTLNGYVAWLDSGRGGSRPLTVIHPEEEVVPLAGFRVVFRGFAESEYQDKLGAVREGLERYRRYATARAPVILRHTPPIFVEWTFEPTTRGDAAGYYAYNGRVNITPWVIGDDVDRFVKTLAHEVGHHIVHTFLSKDAFAAWSRFVRGDYRDLDLREALAVMDRLGARSVIDEVLMVEDPILHLQLSTLMHDPSYSRRDFLFADNIRAYLDGGGNPVVRVPVHPITGYAGKNAEEAFCEAVGNLVAYGPKAVPDVVLGMLRSVLGGGVRIASTRTAAPSIPTARIG